MKKKTRHSCVARRSVLHSANSLSRDITPVIHTRGALLSFVLVDFSLAPFWIWLNSAPRPALLGGLGGKGLDTDGRFVGRGGGASLGRGGVDLGGGDATGWNWTAGRAVLSTDDRLPLDFNWFLSLVGTAPSLDVDFTAEDIFRFLGLFSPSFRNSFRSCFTFEP